MHQLLCLLSSASCAAAMMAASSSSSSSSSFFLTAASSFHPTASLQPLAFVSGCSILGGGKGKVAMVGRLAQRHPVLSPRTTCEKIQLVMMSSEDGKERKRKEVPAHVQDILKRELREDVMEHPPRVSDFKGLGMENRTRYQLIPDTLYVRGIPYSMNDDELLKLFQGFKAVSAKIARDKARNSTSLGFAFVKFVSMEEAKKALDSLDRKEVTVEEKTQGKQLAAQEVMRKKQEIEMKRGSKVIDSWDEVPRRWKVMADKVKMKKNSMVADDSYDDDRASKAVEEFLARGKIEEVSFQQHVKDSEETLGMEGGEILFDLDEDDEDEDEDDEVWQFVPDGDITDVRSGKDVETIEDLEEERRNWEEYKRMQRLNKDNLKDASDMKPSGALRSGQKKMKTWTREQE
ncbi:hypothetical protein GUITHDRAFT_137966 [Guillardia theta CCMP2712]|uniref:RRM domain-containing protein n=2 Tax=Guillardia theta TaxID=55529 RepID=L1JFB2_GUITC|nr:hypothetical protein GUITHDRAFT_137966 [Guillardia theta CCMP2712]EKX47007.1 hypothetical protein GUITHDRAFT_137966 [Guillardia theta CCMP2712]|eukprot:XP_005833987.1 hypothetical protein GUITHDRAFT_137966 [Guillardia theta CCMP2712]